MRFDADADAADRGAALAGVNGETREKLFVPGLRLVEIDGSSVPSAAAELERRPGVRYAEPNFIDEFFAAPNDPDFGLQWALNNTGQDVNGATPGGAGTPDADIDAVEAWNLNRGSASVIVGIADTGVDYNHPDLAPNLYRNPGETGAGKETNGVDDDGNGLTDDFRGWDFLGNDNAPLPSGVMGSNHGTLVAGAAGAQGNNSLGVTGASQQAALMPLRVGDTSSNVLLQVQAYGYASRLGADVINLSAGGTTLSQARLDAIRAAPNTLFVFAAGNDGTNNDTSPIYPCNHNEPNVVCVAWTTQSDNRSSSSNYGPGTVDLAAPGSLIRTTNTPGASYTFASGTSLAAPIVAGVAAVYRARYPSATAADTRDALRGGVDKPASLNNLVETDGRVNFARTLSFDLTPPDTAITSGPKKKLKTRKRKKRVTLEFGSSEPGPAFLCALDGAPEQFCSSPFTKKVKRGKHTFAVRAIDSEGDSDQTPATRAWKVKRKRRKK